MARLPDLNALGARPVPVNRQGIATQDTSAAGRGMAQFGAVISQVGEEISKKNDEQAVFEFRREGDEWERKRVFDQKTGVVSKLGGDALEEPKKVLEEYDAFVGERIGKLTTNRQRQIAQDMAQSRRNQIANFTINHSLRQKEVYEKGQITADLASSSDRAVSLAANGEQGQALAEIDVASSRLMNFMKARGASGEEIALALKTNASKTHSAVVASLVNKGDPLGAQAYLDANKGGMMQDDLTRAGGALKEGALRQKSQAFGDEVMGAGLTLPDALSKARERFTGDEEVAAVHEVKTRFAEAEAVRVQAAKQVATDAWSVLMERGSMSAIPPTMMNKLRAEAPEQERQMRDWLEAKWRRAKDDAENKEQDPSVYYKLRMMAAEAPEQFASLDLLRSQPYLSKQHANHLIELQAGISKGDLKMMESQRTVKRTVDLIRQEIGSAGIDMTPKEGTSKAKETAQFFGALTQALDEATAAKKGPLTNDEAKRVGMSMLREGIEQGSGIFGFMRNKKRGYQIATDPAVGAGSNFVVSTYGEIPKAARDAMLREIYPNGTPRTAFGSEFIPEDAQAEVERMYTRGVQAGRFK